MYYINILTLELTTAQTYKPNLLDERCIGATLLIAAKFGVFVDVDHVKRPTFYW